MVCVDLLSLIKITNYAETIIDLAGDDDITDLDNIVKKLFQTMNKLRFDEKLNIITKGKFRYKNEIPPC